MSPFDTPNFLRERHGRSPQDAERLTGRHEATKRRAPHQRADVPGRQRYRGAVDAPRIGIPRVKGGIRAMAKKTAKGGAKKKGGKKR